MVDYYTSPIASGGSLYKQLGSKFYGYAHGAHSEEEAKQLLNHYKKEHYSARHHCFAWILGNTDRTTRSSDDGEPGNSSGPPILHQIQSLGWTNTMVVVVRYFGGKKLGVSGLIEAYGTAARLALEDTTTQDFPIHKELSLRTSFDHMQLIMRFTKEEYISVINQEFDEAGVLLTLGVLNSFYSDFLSAMQENYLVEVVKHEMP